MVIHSRKAIEKRTIVGGRNAVHRGNMAQALRVMQDMDPTFAWPVLKHRINAVFRMIQDAWCAHDLSVRTGVHLGRHPRALQSAAGGAA